MKKKISKNVKLLSIVSLLNDLSSEMIMPILPMFLTALGANGFIIGLIGGLRDSISNILTIISGYWSDKIRKRKIFVIVGYLSSSLFKLLLSFVKIWPQALIVSSFERIGKGIRTAPRDAIISESMPKKHGKGFGFHRAMDTTGAILGSILVLILFWYWGLSFNTIILIAAIISFASLFPLIFVTEKKTFQKKNNINFSIKTLSNPLKYFLIISGIFALANFSYMFFILKAQQFFPERLAIIIPILLYILFNIFYASLSIPFGNLSDKIGRTKLITIGYLIFSLTSLGFIFSNSLIAFIVLFACYGIAFAIIDSNQRALISDLSTKKIRATALGTFHTLIGIIALPASLIAGYLWIINPNLTFIFGFTISIISVFSFIFIQKKFKIYNHS